AFGVSGTNAHVIVEQAPDEVDAVDSGVPRVGLPVVPWVVSSRSVEGVALQAERLLAGLAELAEPVDAVDVGWSLASTRSGLEHRGVVLEAGTAGLLAGVRLLAEGAGGAGLVSGVARDGKLGFVFSGQGGQRVGMGRELAAVFPVFAEALDEVC